jgi:hypothetical protein
MVNTFGRATIVQLACHACASRMCLRRASSHRHRWRSIRGRGDYWIIRLRER